MSENKVSIKEYAGENLIDKINKYTYAVIYYADRVELRGAQNIKEEDIGKYLEIRAFDKDGELYIASINSTPMGRIRNDKALSAQDTDTIWDEDYLLWGKPEGDSKRILISDRGTIITAMDFDLPKPDNAIDPSKLRWFIKVRNYVDCTKKADGDFVFSDFRLVDIFAKEVRQYGEKE